MRISLWPPHTLWNSDARTIDISWQDFAAGLAMPLDTADKHCQAFAPLPDIQPGKGGRAARGGAGFLGFEYDATATWPLLGRAIAWVSRRAAVIYTTASATPVCPRFRVITAVSRPIADGDEWRSCIDALEPELPAPAPESRQHTRIWYRPIRHGKMPPIVVVGSGDAYDVDDAVRRCPPKPRPVGVERTEDELASWPLAVRVDQARAALARRSRPCDRFVAACVCRDFGVPEAAAVALVAEYKAAIGGAYSIDEIAERVGHAYEHAQGPIGSALIPTVLSHPHLATRFAASAVAR